MKIKNILYVCATILTILLSACTTTDVPRKSVCMKPAKSTLKNSNGNPESYCVDGQTYYVMKSAKGYCKTGLASWYGTKFHGRPTSSKEPYDMFALTAASRNLPLPTYVEVTNLDNGKKIIVKVNDRGPFKSDRIIDLSYGAATKLGFASSGTANVQVRAIDQEEMQNSPSAAEAVLAAQTPEIEINPLELPRITQVPKSVTLERHLQLGAFSNRDNAAKLQKSIREYTDAPVLIKEGVKNDKPIYRVQIGPFTTAEQSDEILTILNKHGFDVITIFS